MGKITFYCNICAGPLSDWELRKRSMLQPGELAHVCFDDECDCDYEGGAANDEGGEDDNVDSGDRTQTSQEEEEEEEEGEGEDDSMIEPNSEEDLARHDSYCNYRRGYWGDILAEGDVEWLSEACMLRMRGFDDESTSTDEDEDEDTPSRYPSGVNPGGCYVTHSGSYDAYDGLSIPRTGEDYYPNQDGFMLHSKCWSMLHFVFAFTRPDDGLLDYQRLYQTMLGKLAHRNDIYIDWGDERLYGGTEEFAEQEWVPVPGCEWLVADPIKDGDFFDLVRESTNRSPELEPGSLVRLCGYTPIAVSDDPFARLPLEVRHMILELLPAKSVLNSFLSSRILCASSASLPQSFWKSRIFTDIPWAVRPSLLMSISQETGRVDSKVLLKFLKKAGAAPLDGRNARYEAWLSLKNRRRIWRCCEGILDAMKMGRRESGYVSRDLEALTSSRIARIRQPELREMGKLVNGETYFRPTTLDQPSLRSLTVYFSEQMSVVGVEWQLEGETAGRLFGNRGAGMQSVAFPQGLVIAGIVISLGSASRSEDKRRAIRGFGLLSADDYRSCVRLGKWADGDIVHVFHPAKTRPDATIVGIAGQYSDTSITQFGILTADVIHKTPPTVTPTVSNLDIYTRWNFNYIPPPNNDIQLQIRHGILGFPLPDISPFDPPILENPAQYIDLRDRQIASIQTFYPRGQNKEFGGFRIDFADGSHEVVHKEEEDPGFHYLKEVVTFDVEAKEAITKLICYFNSNPSRTTPSVLHGVELITSKNRKLGLGWLDAYNENYRRDSYIRRGERVVGLHFGIVFPFIESIGLAVSSS